MRFPSAEYAAQRWFPVPLVSWDDARAIRLDGEEVRRAVLRADAVGDATVRAAGG
jgi:hypothetical protein